MALLAEAWSGFTIVNPTRVEFTQPSAGSGSYAPEAPQGALNNNDWTTLNAVPAPLGIPQSAGRADDGSSHSLLPHGQNINVDALPASTVAVATSDVDIAELHRRVADLEDRVASRDSELVMWYIAVGGLVVLVVNAIATRK
jgi:hypothetical protein